MRFDIITIFPKIFDSYTNESIIGRAVKKSLITAEFHDLRLYTANKHKKVDDRPYGGGPGMILQVEPIARALAAVIQKAKAKKPRVIMLTPAGKQFTQKEARRLSKYDQIVLLCGRYEGFDARVDSYVDEKISIGPYVLAGGELPAMIVMEAVARHIPEVLGHEEALVDETFSHGDNYVEYPQYSRPEIFEGKRVPKVLLSGDHQKVAAWRATKAKSKLKPNKIS
jgi:tRNA (guanine37-N1)-methyltransferase